jgi:hypothetical protein
MTQQALNPWPQTLVGAGVLLIGLALAAGALTIPADAGYGGVGPNFLPWVVCRGATLCGAWIVWEARTGGFREMDEPWGDAAYWPAFHLGVGRPAGQCSADHHARLHPELHAVLCAGGAGPAPRGAPARRRRPGVWDDRVHRSGDLGAGVLDVHAVPGHQSAGPHLTGWI